MPLDVHICGSGFGEMILLRWEERGVQRAGLIDGYCLSEDVEPLLAWLEKYGVRSLAFIVVTHPHLDHLYNLDLVLMALEGRVDRLWYWPGLNQTAYISYFHKLAQKCPESSNDLGKRAKAIMDLFYVWKHQFHDIKLGKPELSPVSQMSAIYPIGSQSGEFEITCIGPWENPVLTFTSIVASGIKPGVGVTDTHREANLVSSGFLIKYGRSQVLLGGDMEVENWQELHNRGLCDDLNPCVVKVSHHGSSTGCLPTMWGPEGFLGRGRPVAVVTPWNQKLPEHKVLGAIASTCETYLTGQHQHPRAREVLSEVHIRVYQNPNARPDVIFKSPTVARVRATPNGEAVFV